MKASLIVILLAICFKTVELVQVNVTQGTLEGEIVTSVINVTYYSFKGIPYAAPPNGTLRFKAPQPPLSWEGVRNATQHGSICPQVDIFTGIEYPGSEDCLFLNVYTANIKPKKPFSVMVYIHGGGFKSGSGNVDFYAPDFLVNDSVVIVTFNYRLEALGFLSFGDEEVPGNAGLKDQVAALKWVKENIKNFGGDPDQVTIFGQSAGAASVAYHLLSPMSKGLFKRAISMSGVPLCDFATPYKPVDRAFILGKQLGIDTDNTTVLLNYLQNVTSDKLYNLNTYLLASEPIINNFIKMYNFVPVVEKDYGTNSSFLTQNTLDILKNGTINEVDTMFGYTDQETVTVVDTFVSTLISLYDRWPELLVPWKILIQYGPDVNLAVANITRHHYFDNGINNSTNSSIAQFVTATTESSFIYDINRFVYMLPTLSNNTRYVYKLSAYSGRNYYGKFGEKYNITGAGHLDDTLYLFDAKSLNMTITADSTEYSLVRQICALWSNFAKYGNPTPSNSTLNVTWPQYDRTNKTYLNIGNNLTVVTDPDAASTTFWKSIFDLVGLNYYVT